MPTLKPFPGAQYTPEEKAPQSPQELPRVMLMAKWKTMASSLFGVLVTQKMELFQRQCVMHSDKRKAFLNKDAGKVEWLWFCFGILTLIGRQVQFNPGNPI